MLNSIVIFTLIAASLRCVCGIQNGGYVVIKGKKEKQLNVTDSCISSPRSRIECAEWCLRNPWCVAATYIQNGGPNGMKCFPSPVQGGCLEEDKDAVFIKKKEIIPAAHKVCKGFMEAGFVNDGWFRITPDGATEIDVVCDMTTTGGGWTVIQQRRDGTTDFYRGWVDYENGFGDPTLCRDYWIGLKNIHELTSTNTNELYIKLTTADGQEKYARYSSFSLDDASNNYTLHVAGYSGDAGDSLAAYHDGVQFSTFDNDHTDYVCTYASSCPVHEHGAWWYRCCSISNLNGEYQNTTSGNDRGMTWSYLGWNSMMHTTMMLRSVG